MYDDVKATAVGALVLFAIAGIGFLVSKLPVWVFVYLFCLLTASGVVYAAWLISWLIGVLVITAYENWRGEEE